MYKPLKLSLSGSPLVYLVISVELSQPAPTESCTKAFVPHSIRAAPIIIVNSFFMVYLKVIAHANPEEAAGDFTIVCGGKVKQAKIVAYVYVDELCNLKAHACAQKEVKPVNCLL